MLLSDFLSREDMLQARHLDFLIEVIVTRFPITRLHISVG